MRLAMVGGFVVGWIAWAGGCGTAGVFECESDEQCRSGAVDGACQGNGYCSFPDGSCDTGQRFGDAAPAGVANACVEPSAGTETSTSGTEGISTRADQDPELESSTTAPMTSTSTTTPLDDGESNEVDGSTSTSPGSTGEGTTTGVIERCATIEDDFDGDAIDPMWSVSTPAGTSIAQQGGQLEISIASSPGWLSANLGMELGPLSGGWARVMITDPTDLALSMVGGITLNNGVCDLQIYLDEGTIRTFRWNNDTQSGEQLAEHELPALPVWLQLRQDDEGIHFEWSEDEVSWQWLTTGTFPECGDITGSLTLLVVAGAQFVQRGDMGLRRFERFEACVP